MNGSIQAMQYLSYDTYTKKLENYEHVWAIQMYEMFP